MAHDLERIDWSAPWLAPYRDPGQTLARQVLDGQSCAQVLDAAGAPVRFVTQAELPSDVAYERFIFETRRVPTRDGLHDFFNGLVWQAFPLTKLRLNALQAAQIAADGIRPVRGPLRDAITVLDENGALLQAPDALWEALVTRDWQRLFVTERALWAQARLWLFGHALLEKLVQPRKAITAHVLRVPGATTDRPAVDEIVSRLLDATWLADKPFVPLPVLGVPGWWPANAAAGFYADSAVFRPLRDTPDR